jgi:hypothetical protein
MADEKKVELTKQDSHRATERGYAIPQRKEGQDPPAGELIEAGKMVPAEVPVSENWMEPVGGKAEQRLARAVEEAQDPQPDDIDLEQIKGDALTAHAARFGINRNRLADADLRKAIRAAHDKDRTQ